MWSGYSHVKLLALYRYQVIFMFQDKQKPKKNTGVYNSALGYVATVHLFWPLTFTTLIYMPAASVYMRVCVTD